MRKPFRSSQKDRCVRDEGKRKEGRRDEELQCSTSSSFHELPTHRKLLTTKYDDDPARSSNNNSEFPASRTSAIHDPATSSNNNSEFPASWTGANPRVSGSKCTDVGSTPVPSGPGIQPILPVKLNHKKTRRGKRTSEKMYCKNLNKTDKSWSILHTNIRGFTSKKKSLKNIINQIRPNVVTINEVGLRKDKKVALLGFNCYTRNRKTNENMGGVATAVVEDEKSSTLKMLEGENKDEFIVTRHGQFQRAINVINYYGEQESRTENIEIEERWGRLTKILNDIENKEEEAILIGDLNKLVGSEKSRIKDNKPKISFAGKLVLELISSGNYLLVNGSEKCNGGPFTRQEPNHPDVESCLDLVIVSKGLVEYIQELVIDKNRNFTPHRAGKRKVIIASDIEWNVNEQSSHEEGNQSGYIEHQ